MVARVPDVPIGEIAAINPKGPGPGTLSQHELVDFLPMSDLSEDGTMAVSAQRPYSEVAKGYTAFRPGDVLLAKITPCFENNKIGLANVETEWAFGSTEFHVLRPGKDVDSGYLLHFLRQDAIRAAGEKRMTGSGGQRRVPKSFLEELPIPLPPLAEQKRIAAILDQADALRRLRRRALDRLNTLGQAIFQEMFGESRSARSVALRNVGKVVTGSTPPTSHSEYFGGPIPFITPGDLETSEAPKRSLTLEGATKSRTVEAGATLVCCIGATIGKIGRVTVRSAFNQQINAVQWGSEVNPMFGYYSVRQNTATIQHLGRGASTTLPILKKSTFEKIEITIYDRKSQDEVCEKG
ncbi:MAG: restriction endonuclease subunit S [Amaricoccus sp.]